MIQIDLNTETNLDDLAREHYESLILPQNIDETYHASQSLIGRIQKQLEEDISDSKRVEFWNYFLKNDCENLERTITARPDELSKIILEIEANTGHNLLSTNIDYKTARLTPFGKIVNEIFGYINYRKNDLAKKNVEQFNLNYCPYCNIHKLENIIRVNGLKGNQKYLALFQLDHFYPKSRYPYLSVSLFNLIPGCSPCNAQLKLEKDFKITTHINPFLKSFNDFFSFQLTKLVFQSKDDVKLEIVKVLPHSFIDNVDFELEDRYNEPNTQMKVFDMIEVLKHKSPSIQNSITNQFSDLYQKPGEISDVLLKALGIPVEVEKINDYEMGKMKRDIYLQLKVLK